MLQTRLDKGPILLVEMSGDAKLPPGQPGEPDRAVGPLLLGQPPEIDEVVIGMRHRFIKIRVDPVRNDVDFGRTAKRGGVRLRQANETGRARPFEAAGQVRLVGAPVQGDHAAVGDMVRHGQRLAEPVEMEDVETLRTDADLVDGFLVEVG